MLIIYGTILFFGIVSICFIYFNETRKQLRQEIKIEKYVPNEKKAEEDAPVPAAQIFAEPQIPVENSSVKVAPALTKSVLSFAFRGVGCPKNPLPKVRLFNGQRAERSEDSNEQCDAEHQSETVALDSARFLFLRVLQHTIGVEPLN